MSGTPRWALAIHGGAGTLRRQDLTPDVERAYLDALGVVLSAGESVLTAGGSALDAVEAAVVVFEDSPLFNCGRGAVFTADGRIELDAAIMDGRTLEAGAVATVRHVRNPVRLARAVLERSPHVLLVAEGAEAFAREQGVALVDPGYFWTARRWDQLVATRRALGEDVTSLSEDTRFDPGAAMPVADDRSTDTVGAVALDAAGHLAAATSTGGLTNKRPGRVGDSAIIGAGTYADDRTCAVSATGVGEAIMRVVVAHEVAARMRHGGQTLEQAADEAILHALVRVGGAGSGGLVAVDPQGRVVMPFNSGGMYRGCVVDGGARVVGIHRALAEPPAR
jgi:beta-aspartyl-peptidase (threonine type)